VHALERIDDPGTLKRLVQAIVLIDGDVSLSALLQHLVEQSCVLVGASLGELEVLPKGGLQLRQHFCHGLEPGTSLVTSDELSSLLDGRTEPRRVPARGSRGPVLAAPIHESGHSYAHLVLAGKAGGGAFSEEDEAAVAMLALAASVAIENARLHTMLRDSTLAEDRDRIARDLHDTVIQRLFAVGLALQGTVKLVENPDVAGRIADAITKLDETIRQLRSAIFDLEETLNQGGFRRLVFDLLFELSPSIGFQPHVSFSGTVDSGLPDDVVEDVLATLREALTNVAKHARATHVVVTFVIGDELRLVVADDGRGLGEGSDSGHGLKNMRARAQARAGNLELSTSREGGTRLIWHVPLGTATPTAPPTENVT